MSPRTLSAPLARLSPALLLLLATPVLAQTNVVGQWSPVYSWPQVAIHMSLLPDGRVISFADDDNPNYLVNGARLAGSTKAYVVDIPLDGAPGTVTFIPNERTNMFCSGHSLVADGRLFVIGGHLGKDGWGEPRTEFFDYRTPTNWWPGPDMFLGRWYPSACVLGNGDVLAISGSNDSTIQWSTIPEVWSSAPNGAWRQLTGANRTLPYYPFTILAPDGRVFIAGPNPDTRFLDCAGTGAWSTAKNHVLNVTRSYGSAVQYADGKIMVAGGNDPPTNSSEIIDLNSGTPTWTNTTEPMHFARRQMNLTILPDGNVLASGGSSASGFNNNDGAVFTPEMWTPADGLWTDMAPMAKARIYHSTTVLLPDGRVLSAGSGRPKPTGTGGVDQLNCEIYSPPYLFKGARPTISSAPSFLNNGAGFTIQTPDAAGISQVTLVRLSSTTHAFNMGQRFNRLSFTKGSGTLQASIPASSNLVPPGFYMLFILNSNGVPSYAKMVQILTTGPVGVSDQPSEALLDFMALRSANPMRGGTAKIAFALSHSEVGRIEILDVTGRRVKVVADGYFDAGREQVVTWDGTDEYGHRVQSGLYWYRLQTPSLTRSGKLALLSY